jgi:hypothetical protein
VFSTKVRAATVDMQLRSKHACPFRGVTLETTVATVQLRVQLWSVNQRAKELEEISIAKIRHQETFSEDIAEE